jgi:transposase-like protein
MMENGKSRKRRQPSPEEKWEIFLEVTSQEVSQADAARKWRVDVSVIIRLRALAKDAALAAFASAKPGRLASGAGRRTGVVAGASVHLFRAKSGVCQSVSTRPWGATIPSLHTLLGRRTSKFQPG